MSEPIFRAWCNKDKEWIHEDCINVRANGKVWMYNEDGDETEIDATLCRSTGLKDSKGEMIFENDIVKGHYGARNSIESGVIFYDKRLFQWCVKDSYNNEFPVHGFDQIPYRKTDVEIIGNIFENKHLLEVKE